MTTDPTQTKDDAIGANAVAYLADELGADERAGFEAMLRDDATAGATLAALRGVDASLRAVADAESPSVGELRRTREASARFARTRAAAIVAAARRPAAARRLPRWSIAAAAAVLVVGGVVSWMSISAPTSLPAKTQPEVAERSLWYDDWRDYSDLVYAFTPVEVRTTDATVPATDVSSDEVETQVDALNAVTAMAQE